MCKETICKYILFTRSPLGFCRLRVLHWVWNIGQIIKAYQCEDLLVKILEINSAIAPPPSHNLHSAWSFLIRLICSNFSKHQTDHDIASYARLVSWDKISQFLVITASQSAGEVCRAFPRLCTIFCLKLQAIFCNTTIIRRCLSRALSSSSLAGNSPGSLFNYR